MYRMFKRLMMTWLIICTLGYGSVWAFDAHSDEGTGHQTTSGNVDYTLDEGGDHPDCDHCCHASAHVIALWPAQSKTDYTGSRTSYTPYRHTLAFNATAPPERPPQA